MKKIIGLLLLKHGLRFAREVAKKTDNKIDDHAVEFACRVLRIQFDVEE